MDKVGINNSLLSEKDCPKPSELLSYSKNVSSENTRNIELHIASCKLCSDAIEGFNNASFPIDLKFSENTVKSKRINLVNLIIVSGIVCTIIGLIYFSKNENKETILIMQQDSIVKKSKKDLKIETEKPIKSDSVINAIEKIKITQNSNERKIIINPINKISANKINEKKAEDSLATKSYTPPKREFFKSAFPIKYVNELKTIDYQHLYENIESKNIPVLKSLDPRYENLKSKLEASDNTNEQKLSYNEVLETALLAFSYGDFETCERYFTLILNNYPDDQNALFYKGVSFYKQNRIEQAIPLLDKLSQRNSSPFMEEAQWNLANCYKEQNRIIEMKIILQKLIDKNGFYSEKANTMLNQF